MKNKHLIWAINRKKDRLRLNDDIKHKRVILHPTKNSKIFVSQNVES
jgi:hypothetical protein